MEAVQLGQLRAWTEEMRETRHPMAIMVPQDVGIRRNAMTGKSSHNRSEMRDNERMKGSEETVEGKSFDR